MYKVLLVDDEVPALRFLQAIFEKYAHDFQVSAVCQSGEEALNYLQNNRVDLLLTDISMPGMDGIALAQQVRRHYPDMRMVIVSGYAEFKYAQGAIQAAVDDYILKPVSISHMTATLDKIKVRLDSANADQEPALLETMLSSATVDQELLRQLYGSGKYYFAMVRWGNLTTIREEALRTTSAIPVQGVPFHVLSGRYKEEQILYMKQETPGVDFFSAVKAYVAQHTDCATWTILFCRNAMEFSAFPRFVRKAENAMRNSVIIGRRQFIYLQSSRPDAEIPHIPAATLKKLEYFCQNGNKKLIKDLFITLSTDWEKRQITQVQTYHMVQQLIHTIRPILPVQPVSQDVLLQNVWDLFICATNYGELMAGLYSLLLDEGLAKDKKLSPEELFSYATSYIHERYAEPISITNVCSEIGISQTYLSRLFRKYGNTSFQAYLTQHRIESAKGLIREHPDMRLRDVAACVGYDDPSYFSKVFHQATGYTPSQWAEKIE
ncbi:MAG: response regulator [Clostridia bacterium]|nr:response regulator [Clostridia bacterium]